MTVKYFPAACLTVVAWVVFLMVGAVNVSAHSGRTDARGGHNCNVGACAGTYHYHNGGSTPAPSIGSTPAPPRQPLVTTKIITADESVFISSKTVKTNQEYAGYKRIQKMGTAGLKRTHTKVTLRDGAEIARVVIKTEIIKQPEASIKLVGTRKKPQAKITSIKKVKNKFIVSGIAKKNSEVVLAVEGRRIKRAKTDSKGKFIFKNIKLGPSSTKIEIYNRVNGKESLISEKSIVKTATGKFKTEYSEKL